MKKLTNYQRTAQYLNKVFKLINEEYFNNELEVPTITIQSTVGAYGHVSVNKVWHNDTVATHELNLSADYLNRPIENIVATLIHEGCHLYALQNNIKDTSNRGIYHNKRFKALAEERGLQISRHETYGWTITEPTDLRLLHYKSVGRYTNCQADSLQHRNLRRQSWLRFSTYSKTKEAQQYKKIHLPLLRKLFQSHKNIKGTLYGLQCSV